VPRCGLRPQLCRRARTPNIQSPARPTSFAITIWRCWSRLKEWGPSPRATTRQRRPTRQASRSRPHLTGSSPRSDQYSNATRPRWVLWKGPLKTGLTAKISCLSPTIADDDFVVLISFDISAKRIVGAWLLPHPTLVKPFQHWREPSPCRLSCRTY
jgi:hypothetical protein